MEFHIARSLRDKLDLSEVLFSYTGNVVFANVGGARRLATGLNTLRGETAETAASITANTAASINGGALFAMGLIDELCHALVARYRTEIDPDVLTDAMVWFEKKLGKPELDRLLLGFATDFPNVAVYTGVMTPAEWLAGSTDGSPNAELELEELMMLWLANRNPAFQQFRELFADDTLKKKTAYPSLTTALPDYFATRPEVPEIGTLLDALEAPMLAAPDSLIAQLEFIRENWEPQLGKELRRTLLAIDVVREEDVAIWMRFHPPTGRTPQHGEPGWEAHGFEGDEYVGFEQDFVIGPDGRRVARQPGAQYSVDHQAPLVEYEAFSPDQAWMPNVVMMAKSTYVWLEQLSKKYQRHIHRLDQIPDEELKLLADRGMTALWLIGLWERSVASRTIKRLRGQADAVASAYSLKDYNIADDLGGNAAYESLRDRAAAFGLRLASDMVPNHMGIDSPWVIEHPEWFITRPESPFPVYRFDGPDLSGDSRAEIKLEDHYYDMTDAAVAFRLKTHRDGQTHFMYHGNDGTTFAWNDTAQLDYSKASVREHIIQTILHVARLFPIIRFDAAMVLAKRHVQRLWFPLPGVGGSIPSRAENAMSQEEFDALMPNEFWREVVDRVAVDVPGTLLLAEAFWLLEGYFVRTLGMHRVYNSAFMNMLRDEENAKYRSYLKKTIEFDPDIMKRYVNFMSNPDEKTAAEQFGTGDKYFGSCTLLATLPGLPMFAHGQVEGFSERYGMDFKEAKLNETPNEGLIDRYNREITPLLRKRYVFAESEHFVLYDFFTDNGTVDENVLTYSNRSGNERAIILYNNIYGSTRGTIRMSAASFDKASGELRQRSLIEALALPSDNEHFVAYRDNKQGLDFLRRASELRDRGLTYDLHGYQYVVLELFRELRATAEMPWDRLHDALHGSGVPKLEDALANLRLRPVHDALRGVLPQDRLEAFAKTSAPAPPVAAAPVKSGTTVPEKKIAEPTPVKAAVAKDLPAPPTAVSPDPTVDHFIGATAYLMEQVGYVTDLPIASTPGDPAKFARKALAVPTFHAALPKSAQAAAARTLPSHAAESIRLWSPLLAWAALASLPPSAQTSVFDELKLRQMLGEHFNAAGIHGEDAWRTAARVRVLLAYPGDPLETLQSDRFWRDADVQWLVGRSESNGIEYFNKEKFEDLFLPMIALSESVPPALLERVLGAAAMSGFRIQEFRQLLKQAPDEDEPTPTAAKPKPVPIPVDEPVSR